MVLPLATEEAWLKPWVHDQCLGLASALAFPQLLHASIPHFFGAEGPQFLQLHYQLHEPFPEQHWAGKLVLEVPLPIRWAFDGLCSTGAGLLFSDSACGNMSVQGEVRTHVQRHGPSALHWSMWGPDWTAEFSPHLTFG